MHNKFLLSALEQAWFGRGRCAPNPAVGAVAVQHGLIIAQASHRGAGTPHAEQLLLAQFPVNTPEVTLYVTLEPCNHWGKTPPCVDAIIKHGIKRVVYGFRDPNPVVEANDTFALLTAHGIEVIYHPMPQVNQFYESYHYWTSLGKPWVTVKIAQTFDGKIAGEMGRREHLSNALCHEFTHTSRMHADVILTTAHTVALDDPQLNVRIGSETFAKPIAILDRTLSLPLSQTVFKTAAHCHIYHDDTYAVSKPFPNCTYHKTPSYKNGLDLSFVLHHLGHMGYHDVWVEAGGGLFSALHHEQLVNRTYIYLVPKLLGENATALCNDSTLFDRAHTISWHEMGDNMIASLDWQDKVTPKCDILRAITK